MIEKGLGHLPRGWIIAELGDFADIKSGLTKGKKRRDHDQLITVPYLRVANVQRGYLDLVDVRTITASVDEVENLQLRFGDILFNEGGDIDKLGRGWVWYNQVNPCIHQNHVFRARLLAKGISSEYVSYFGNSTLAQQYFLRAGKQTTNLASLNRKTLGALPMPFPPANEQRRIVERIETLQERTRNARNALDTIPPLIEKFRQSVLASAFRGDLTADWRAQNPDVEPASVLLERIRKERRRRWEEAELEKMRAKGKVPSGDGWKERYKEPEKISGLPPWSVPSTWTWTSIDAVGDVLLGRQRAPRYQTGEHSRPYLRVANIKEDRILLDDVLEMDFDERDYEKYKLEPGDILLSEGQSAHLVGQSAIYRGDVEGLCFQKTLHRFRPIPSGPNSAFSQLVFRSLLRLRIFMRFASITTNIAHLTLARIKTVPFPLPPADEQREVEKRLARALERIADIEATLQGHRPLCDTLDQSILAKAFRGELVPQDPNDEPASVLLERIRAEKASAEPKRRQRRTKKRAGGTPALPVGEGRSERAGGTPALPVGEGRSEKAGGTPALPVGDGEDVGDGKGVGDGSERRTATELTAEDWQRAVLESIGDEVAEREFVIEAAALWAAENLGLEFQRLRRDGVIVKGLKNALRALIRRGDVLRLDAVRVQRA